MLADDEIGYLPGEPFQQTQIKRTFVDAIFISSGQVELIPMFIEYLIGPGTRVGPPDLRVAVPTTGFPSGDNPIPFAF